MDEGTFQGWSQALQNFEGCCSKKSGSKIFTIFDRFLTDLDFFGREEEVRAMGWAKRGEINVSGWG